MPAGFYTLTSMFCAPSSGRSGETASLQDGDPARVLTEDPKKPKISQLGLDGGKSSETQHHVQGSVRPEFLQSETETPGESQVCVPASRGRTSTHHLCTQVLKSSGIESEFYLSISMKYIIIMHFYI